MSKICSVPACTNPVHAKGMCKAHYLRMYKHGTTELRIAARGAALDFLFNTALNYKNKRKCLIWPYGGAAGGYGCIYYKKRSRRVHRLVCRLVHGKPPTKEHHACHTCGKGHEGCINPHHLYWGTAKQNQADRIKHGTTGEGEKNGQALLTEKEVRRIIRLLDQGCTSVSLARKFGVSRQTIGSIRSGKNWKHIKREAA